VLSTKLINYSRAFVDHIRDDRRLSMLYTHCAHMLKSQQSSVCVDIWRQRWTWPSAVNTRPTTVTYSASIFVYSMVGDLTRRRHTGSSGLAATCYIYVQLLGYSGFYKSQLSQANPPIVLYTEEDARRDKQATVVGLRLQRLRRSIDVLGEICFKVGLQSFGQSNSREKCPGFWRYPSSFQHNVG